MRAPAARLVVIHGLNMSRYSSEMLTDPHDLLSCPALPRQHYV